MAKEQYVEKDIAEVFTLQQEIVTRLGKSQDFLNRSYNPAFDRWHILSGVEDEQSGIRKEILTNIETNLKERFAVTESDRWYRIIDGKIYGENVKKEFEPMGQIMLRGAVYRKQEGSKETRREGIEGELGGWLTLQSILTDQHTPIGTKVVSFSPPGIIPDTVYKNKFIDLYERTSIHTIHFERIAVDYDDDKYKQVALEINPHFFDAYDDRPIDAWYLSHPIVISAQEHVRERFELAIGMSAKDFSFIFDGMNSVGHELYPFIKEYMRLITGEYIDWASTLIAFNAILNKSDELVRRFEQRSRRSASFDLEWVDAIPQHTSFIDTIQWYGTQTVRTSVGGGCPSNSGFSFSQSFGLFTIPDIFSNSVMQFGLTNTETTWDYHTGDCVVCERKQIDVGPCNICKECEKKF